MDYERIHKPQGGGLSPSKLRTMLMGVEKKRKEVEELESVFSLRAESAGIDDGGISASENCKDVTECWTSTATEATNCDVKTDCSLKEFKATNSRVRSLEESTIVDYDSGHDSGSVSSAFEFQKSERNSQRVSFTPFSKPAPSKWDDAQKWIASPTSNRQKTRQSQPPSGQAVGSRKMVMLSYGGRQSVTKFPVEIPSQKEEEADTKRIDFTQSKKEVEGQKFVDWAPDPCPVAASYATGDSAVSLNRRDSSISFQSATTFIPPPSTIRSVSMRDMGTEMTPIASQEPSRTGTPVRATTPTRSPSSSRPSTPGRVEPASSPIETDDILDLNRKELSQKELQMKTRQEIMMLGTQLGKMNIAAWASKEEEDKGASTSLKTMAVDEPHPAKSVIEMRAETWEEAEKSKYMARYRREEIKIQAWENHQKAKSEAEMRRIEVDVERMRASAHDKLMNKLAAARHKAEAKRAVAEAKLNRQAAKTEQQAEYIRRTGQIPTSYSFCSWCY